MYVNFARRSSWKEAIMSSLTEMFAPQIHQQRLSTWPNNYPWIEQKVLDIFKKIKVKLDGMFNMD